LGLQNVLVETDKEIQKAGKPDLLFQHFSNIIPCKGGFYTFFFVLTQEHKAMLSNGKSSSLSLFVSWIKIK
jgi:hypothetical protein